jgi:hypothetical protein
MSDFIRTNITDILPAVFEGDNKRHADFQNRISRKFNIDPNHVYIVGSGALGFSFTKNGSAFDLNSDIDVAIVDEGLYEEYSKILSSYHYEIMYRRTTLGYNQKVKYRQFLEYYAVGWLRPDKGTDIMNRHPNTRDWWEYFKSISYDKSEVGNHKVNAGIYKSEYYLHKYQEISLLNHRKGII